MKKTIMILPAIALALTLTLPALAYDRENNDNCCASRDKKCCPELKIDNTSSAEIKNMVGTMSNTGLNKVTAKKATLITGTATSMSDTTNLVNDTKITVKAPAKGKVEVKNNNQANVGNYVMTISNSGMNAVTAAENSYNTRTSRHHQSNDDQGATVGTGDAFSASTTMTVVNQNVIAVD